MFGREPKYVQATLDWCNEMRVKRGRKPLDRLPKGTRVDPSTCPCGTATGLSVVSTDWTDMETFEKGFTPNDVSKFIRAFDAGRLPQYDVNYKKSSRKFWK